MIEAECKISYKDLSELEEKARAFDELMEGEKSDYVIIQKWPEHKIFVHKKPNDVIAFQILNFYSEIKKTS